MVGGSRSQALDQKPTESFLGSMVGRPSDGLVALVVSRLGVLEASAIE